MPTSMPSNGAIATSIASRCRAPDLPSTVKLTSHVQPPARRRRGQLDGAGPARSAPSRRTSSRAVVVQRRQPPVVDVQPVPAALVAVGDQQPLSPPARSTDAVTVKERKMIS